MMVRRVLVAAAACLAAAVAAVPASASACYHPRPATTHRTAHTPVGTAPVTRTAAAPLPTRQPTTTTTAPIRRAPAPPDPPPRPAAPVAAPAPVATVSAPAASGDPIQSAFGPLGPGAVSWAQRVSACESSGNAGARSPSGAVGLFQFMPSTWASTPQGQAGASMNDPNASAQAAAWMYSQGRQSAWNCT